MLSRERFVRLPTQLLEALLPLKLTGVQLRMLLWVIRKSYGWNRISAPFTWYRMARELLSDRGGVCRAGHALLNARVLLIEDGRVRIQPDEDQWQLTPPEGRKAEAEPHVTMSAITADRATRASGQPSSFFRPAKDSHKERKTSNAMQGPQERKKYLRRRSNPRLDPHPAGAAKPVEGKYDPSSQR